MKNSFELL